MTTRREKLEAMLATNPDDVFLHFGLAMEYAKEQSIEQAVAGFDKAIALDDRYAAAYFHKGQVLARAGRVDESRSVIELGMAKCKGLDDHAVREMGEFLETLE